MNWTPKDARWKAALAAGAMGLLVGRCTAPAPTDLPDSVRRGATIVGYQLQGDDPVYGDSGLEIVEVRAPWVAFRQPAGDGSTRWVDFRRVEGFVVRRE